MHRFTSSRVEIATGIVTRCLDHTKARRLMETQSNKRAVLRTLDIVAPRFRNWMGKGQSQGKKKRFWIICVLHDLFKIAYVGPILVKHEL